MRRQPEDKLIIRYLFGDLPEKEKVRLEELYFADDEFFELMQAIEDELIDRYVSGKLSVKERELFENNYLQNPLRRKKVDQARSLSQSLSEISGRVSKPDNAYVDMITNWLKTTFSAIGRMNRSQKFAFIVSLLLAIFCTWFVIKLISTRKYLRQVESKYFALQEKEQELQQQVASEISQRNELVAQLDSEQRLREQLEQRIESSPLLSFALSPGSLRDVRTPEKLILPAGSYKILLQLDIESEITYQSYRMVIRDKDSEVVWSKDGLMEKSINGGRMIDITLNSNIFFGGNYQITLLGLHKNKDLNFVGRYDLNIIKK